jgi:hypothetical protein
MTASVGDFAALYPEATGAREMKKQMSWEWQQENKSPHRHHIRMCKMFDMEQYQCGCGRYFNKKQFELYVKDHLFEGISDEELPC